MALDQQEESEEDDFGFLDVAASDKKAPRPTQLIDEDDEEDDDEGMAPFDDEDVDLDAELELVSFSEFDRAVISFDFEQQVDPDDMKTMDALLPTNQVERRTLADMIFSKLGEVEAGQKTVIKVGRGHPFSVRHPKLINLNPYP